MCIETLISIHNIRDIDNILDIFAKKKKTIEKNIYLGFIIIIIL